MPFIMNTLKQSRTVTHHGCGIGVTTPNLLIEMKALFTNPKSKTGLPMDNDTLNPLAEALINAQETGEPAPLTELNQTFL